MKFKHRWKKITAGILCLAFLTGCRGGIPMVSEVKDTKSYSLPQSMIIVATERNRYQQVYTDEIWDVTLNNGNTFQVYLLDQVQTFLHNMKTMTLLAKEQEITLSNIEKDQIHRLSETYYNGLTEEDIAYMNISLDDVISLYQEYCLANKVVNELTKDLDLEVSDSEAKVITLQQIELEDADAAKDVYELVTAEGSDFTAIAKESSLNSQIDRQLGRGDETTDFEQVAFSLETDTISPIIQSNGKYFILKCINDYDNAATEKRKTQIYNERKNQVFQQIYSQFQIQNEITFSEEGLQNIVFSSEDETTTTNFFELYKKEFGGQSY